MHDELNFQSRVSTLTLNEWLLLEDFRIRERELTRPILFTSKFELREHQESDTTRNLSARKSQN